MRELHGAGEVLEWQDGGSRDATEHPWQQQCSRDSEKQHAIASAQSQSEAESLGQRRLGSGAGASPQLQDEINGDLAGTSTDGQQQREHRDGSSTAAAQHGQHGNREWSGRARTSSEVEEVAKNTFFGNFLHFSRREARVKTFSHERPCAAPAYLTNVIRPLPRRPWDPPVKALGCACGAFFPKRFRGEHVCARVHTWQRPPPLPSPVPPPPPAPTTGDTNEAYELPTALRTRWNRFAAAMTSLVTRVTSAVFGEGAPTHERPPHIGRSAQNGTQ